MSYNFSCCIRVQAQHTFAPNFIIISKLSTNTQQPTQSLQIGAAVVFVCMLIVFLFIGHLTLSGSNISFDSYIYALLSAITTPAHTELMIHATFFGSSQFLLPAYIVLIIYHLLFRKNFRLSFDVAFIGLVGNLVWITMQNTYHRHRPLDPLITGVLGYGYPSGHSFASFTFFGLIAFLVWQTKLHKYVKVALSALCFMIAATIAISRVYLHVHYATDVTGGFCLSIMWLILALWLVTKIKWRNLLKDTGLH